jgi:hypothetical protein
MRLVHKQMHNDRVYQYQDYIDRRHESLRKDVVYNKGNFMTRQYTGNIEHKYVLKETAAQVEQSKQ